MRIEINSKKLMNYSKEQGNEFLLLFGNVALSEAQKEGERIFKNPSGQMINAGFVSLSRSQSIVSFGYAGIPYAAIRELGGTIEAYNKKFLTIPISEKSRGKEAADFSDAFIVRINEALFIAREKGKGKKLELLFILKKKVTQKATPTLQPGLKAATKQMKEIAQRVRP